MEPGVEDDKAIRYDSNEDNVETEDHGSTTSEN